MRLPSRILPSASPAKLLSRPQGALAYRRIWQSVRYQSSKAPSARFPVEFDEDLKDLYREEYIDFYQRHIAGRAIRNPFKDLKSPQYPCSEDYQPATAPNVTCNDVILPRNATGSILLRVYNSTETHASSPVILYFPSRGTNPLPSTSEHHLISHLTRLTRSTTISVGYRISPPFPLSLHDCLAAIDWARTTIPAISLESYCENNFSGRLMAVLGTSIGGSIASSIGATEGRESGIIAAGSWLPIVDWAFDPLPSIPPSPLSTLPRSPSLLTESSEFEATSEKLLETYNVLADTPFLSSAALQTIRSYYFANAEDFTDPFASPLYRFSTTGVNIWTSLIARIEYELLANPENPPKWIESITNTVFGRGLRRVIPYPETDQLFKLTIPAMRIVSADGDILHNQTLEFVKAARNSVFPVNPGSIEDRQIAEARELQRAHSNDELVENPSRVPSTSKAPPEEPPLEVGVEVEEAEAEAKTDADEDMERRQQERIDEAYRLQEEKRQQRIRHASNYIQHDIIQGAGHCLITGASEISDGAKEVHRMAAWLNAVFQNEPATSRRYMASKAAREVAREHDRKEKIRQRMAKL